MVVRADLAGTPWEPPVVVGAVHHLRKVLLLDVVQGGQQQGSQDGNDGDHHQQFNQRKASAWFQVHFPSAFNSSPVLPP